MATCPCCGEEADNSGSDLCQRCAHDLFSLNAVEPPRADEQIQPPLPAPNVFDVATVRDAFAIHHGFTRVHWKWVQNQIKNTVPESLWPLAIMDVIRKWLLQVCHDVGGGYIVTERDDFLMVSWQADESRAKLCEFIEKNLARVRSILGDAAWPNPPGKHVFLLFNELDDYDHYISYFYPDGSNSISGGVCIHAEYVHIAAPYRDEGGVRRSLVHEVAHNLVAHLQLPRWLNEGLARASESWCGLRGPLQLSYEEIMAQRQYWTSANIQNFWSGKSFSGSPGRRLSYQLAFVLFHSIKSDAPTFRRFLINSRKTDGGQEAALRELGICLGNLAGQFLGEGDWRPDSAKIATLQMPPKTEEPRINA